MRVALVQLNPGKDKKKNLTAAVDYVCDAARRGADIVALPELFIYRGDPALYPLCAEAHNGATVTLFSALAKALKLTIVMGSIIEKDLVSRNYYDTTFVVSPDGRVASYRKINLFEVHLGTKRLREAEYFEPGHGVSTFDACGELFGLAICFDIRFPQLFAALRSEGVAGFFVPSNFTYVTGMAHWHALLRARAIETQSFIFAPNCVGTDLFTNVKSYGHSVIIDPWGTVIAERKTGSGLLVADIDMKSLAQVRRQLPMAQK